jgi:RNA polymerase sigma-70 factor (ECF subfamily)
MYSTEEQLIRRSIQGDQAAFGKLIVRYQDFVFSLCLRVLQQREEAEEAAQDAFLKAYRKLASFRQQSRFSTWLYTLTYRTALDRARQKGIPVQGIDGEEQYIQLPAASCSLADHQLERRENQQILEQLLQQLPAQERTPLSLYYLQEQSVREIAKITGLTVSNVKTWLFRSRERLRKQVGEQAASLRAQFYE